MTARLKFPLILFATLAVGSSLPAPSRMAAAAGIDPASMPAVLSDAGDAAPEAMVIDDRIMLDSDAGGSVSGEVESILSDGAMVRETGSPIVESVVESAGEPRVLDVSAQAFNGMLMDDFNVDEMPYEASSGRWFWNGGWYVGGESLWMDRSREIRTPLATDTQILPYSKGIRFAQYTTNAQPFDARRPRDDREVARPGLPRSRPSRGVRLLRRHGVQQQLWVQRHGQGWLCDPARVRPCRVQRCQHPHHLVQLRLQQLGMELQAPPPARTRPAGDVARRQLDPACRTWVAARAHHGHPSGEHQRGFPAPDRPRVSRSRRSPATT